MNAVNNFESIAKVWDWDGYDDTAEYEYWCEYAGRYGKKVLMPMCALGQQGAYMARRGYCVTAFDLSREMIREALKRFGDVPDLCLCTADIRNCSFEDGPYDFTFLKGQDLHLLTEIGEVEQALRALGSQLRPGAGLVLELVLPGKQSFVHEKRVFHPRVPNYTDKKVWKEHEGYYDADTGINHISQTVCIEDENGIKKIPHTVELRYYGREELLAVLHRCGFAVKQELCDRGGEPWTE